MKFLEGLSDWWQEFNSLPQSPKESSSVPYPCGYRECANTRLTILEETEKEITVYCSEHDAKTTWLKHPKEAQSQVVKPEWSMDVKKWER